MDETNFDNNLDNHAPPTSIRTVGKYSNTSITTGNTDVPAISYEEELNKAPDYNTDSALMSLASLSLHSVSSSECTYEENF